MQGVALSTTLDALPRNASPVKLVDVNIAIIVAAGRGTRMGSDIDKLFLELAGKPVIAHTWKRFEDCAAIAEVVLVTRADLNEPLADLARSEGFKKPFHLTEGGAERQDSVWNGLEAAPEGTAIVAIHDGARPCVAAELIRDVIEAASKTGAAVTANRLTDTIKESEDGAVISRHLTREKLWAVQTPQAFRIEIIRAAIAEARRRKLTLTDDTAACELINQPVRLVPNQAPNPKVTTPHDLPAIETLLQQRP